MIHIREHMEIDDRGGYPILVKDLKVHLTTDVYGDNSNDIWMDYDEFNKKLKSGEIDRSLIKHYSMSAPEVKRKRHHRRACEKTKGFRTKKCRGYKRKYRQSWMLVHPFMCKKSRDLDRITESLRFSDTPRSCMMNVYGDQYRVYEEIRKDIARFILNRLIYQIYKVEIISHKVCDYRYIINNKDYRIPSWYWNAGKMVNVFDVRLIDLHENKAVTFKITGDYENKNLRWEEELHPLDYKQTIIFRELWEG